MPKKRGFVAPNIEHINAQSSRREFNTTSPSIRTVNDRISQLRAEQAPRPTVEQRRQIETIVTSRSMPPSISNILDIPVTAAPIPRPGSTAHLRLLATLRRAGPSAPRSWLDSMHAPASARSRAKKPGGSSGEIRNKPARFCRLSKLDGPHGLPRSGSLLDQAFKSMAANWDFIAEYEQYNIATIPVALKSILLSYLSVYGPDEGISLDGLKTLFLSDKELADATGSQELTKLDLTGLLSSRFSLGELTKYYFIRPKRVSVHGGNTNMTSPTVCEQTDDASIHELANVMKKLSTETASSDGTTLESWEEAADTGGSSIPSALNSPRFPNLSRLSLGNPGAYSSWPKLLTLSAYLSTITHLSLADWPPPSTDWHEARSMLRRFSNNTYCLRWLDLQGCNEWLRELSPTENARTGEFVSVYSPRPTHFDDLVGTQTDIGPDWNGSWAQIKYVNVSQGLIPTDTRSIRAMPAGVIACDLLLYLRDKEEFEPESENLNIEQWVDREKAARRLATTVRLARNSVKGHFCVFDHGWIPPKAVVIQKEDKVFRA